MLSLLFGELSHILTLRAALLALPYPMHALSGCLDVKSVYAKPRIESPKQLMTCGSKASFHHLMHLNILTQVRFPQTSALHVSCGVCTLPQPKQSW